MSCSRYRLCYSVILVTMAALLVACGGSGESNTGEAPDSFSENPLSMSSWSLASMEVDGTALVPVSDAAHFFTSSNLAYGWSGCNFYTASYNLLQPDRIDISNYVPTAFGCASEEERVQDQAYKLVLESASNFESSQDALGLRNPDSSRTASLVTLPQDSLGISQWKLHSYNDGAGALVVVLTGSTITLEVPDEGQLAGSAGCNDYSASFEASDGQITISTPVTTRQSCSDPAGVMEQESAYLSALEQAQAFGVLGPVLLLLQEDGTPVALYLANDR